MRIITDRDVPNAVVAFLRSRGHEVIASRDILPLDAPDPLIAAAASDLQAAVLTWNRQDFLALVKRRRGPHGPHTYQGMHLITFDNCNHTEGLRRLQSLIDEIESVYELRVVRRGERLIAIIGRTYLKLEDLA